MTLRHYLIFIILLYFSTFTYSTNAQTRDSIKIDSSIVELYFKINGTDLDSNYMGNDIAIKRVKNIMNRADKRAGQESLHIEIGSSIDGEYRKNSLISGNRKEYVIKFLTPIIPPKYLDEATITVHNEDWERFKRLVNQSNYINNKSEILEIANSDDDPDIKEIKLKKVNNGETWSELKRDVLPYLRNITLTSITRQQLERADQQLFTTTIASPLILTSEQSNKKEENPLFGLLIYPDEFETSLRKPLFAVKTNLLFDLATVINVAIEVPIKERWSIVGEWIFPWWRWDNGREDSKRDRFQLLNANLEARYWFGNRQEREQLTGWFIGLYGGVGDYDFERNKKGVQGEFFIAGGLTGGYAHPINRSKSLRLEYSLNVGYLQSNYRRYNSYYCTDSSWRAVKTVSGVYKWFGPTSAKVSLVWLLHYNKRRGGVRWDS